MAQSLIDIKDNKLVFNPKVSFASFATTPESKDKINKIEDINNIEKQIKVISIIGKARTGKSTFLNCLLTYWKSDTQNIFTMSSSGKHCTNGIDIYNISEEGIILLDFQGIYLGDSSNDPKLLLLAYLLSDVIIFNEVKMLSNITLQQFEPMLSFINYLKGKTTSELDNFNPKLIFRISDMSLDIEPTSNMQDMLKEEDDQFQAIRECINDLFDTPYAVCTKNLDRGELDLLKKNQFKEVLDSTENGFDDAISKINDYLECCESRKTISIFLEDLPKILKNINEEKAIDFKKLDIVKSIGENEILKWVLSLGNDIYTDIPVDGTSETYKNVIKRQEEMEKIVKDLDKTFKSIPKTIRDEHSSILRKKIIEKIDKAIQGNKTMAEKLMSDLLEKHLLKPTKFNLNIHFKNIEEIVFDNWIKPFIDRLELIREQGKHIHNVALLPFCKWKLQVVKDIKQKFDEEYKEVSEIIDLYKNKLCGLVETFDNSIDENINEIVKNNDITSPYDTILSKIQTEQYEMIDNVLKSSKNYNNVKNYSFNTVKLPDVYNGGCKMKIDFVNYYTLVQGQNNHDFQNLYNIFTKKIKDILDTKGIELIAKYRNIKLTEMGYLPLCIIVNQVNVYPRTISINNPKTQFINFIFNLVGVNNYYPDGARKLETSYITNYMTADYYKQSLEPILLRTCNRLYEKGYLYDANEPELNGWLKFLKDITDIEVLAPDVKVFNMSFDFYRNTFKNDYKKLAMLEIFENRFKKELIRKV
jgi:hypothetical protein